MGIKFRIRQLRKVHSAGGSLQLLQAYLKTAHDYQSTFERDMLIDVERGVIGEVRVRENEIPALVSAQNV
jgi:hypothetical protein